MGKLISNTPLTAEERKKITDVVRDQIQKRNFDEIFEIKKLKIMLDLFEIYGREFDRELPVPCLNWRALQVRLYNNKNQTCSVVLRRAEIKA